MHEAQENTELRLLVLSDLHLEQWGKTALQVDLDVSRPDVVILAGDIHTGAKAIPWATQTFPGIPVLYVHGNHEGYSHKLEQAQRDIEDACQLTENVQFLNSKEWRLDGVRFLGATLWTDFYLFGAEKKQAAMWEAEIGMNDYHRIRLESRGYKKMRTPDTARFHAEQRSWIRDKLEEPFAGKTVVVTHMAPSKRSVPEQFSADIVSAAYASNLDEMASQVDLWIHGHMHTSSDYEIGSCRVVCNPRGYHLSSGRGENVDFDPNFIIEI